MANNSSNDKKISTSRTTKNVLPWINIKHNNNEAEKTYMEYEKYYA